MTDSSREAGWPYLRFRNFIGSTIREEEESVRTRYPVLERKGVNVEKEAVRAEELTGRKSWQKQQQSIHVGGRLGSSRSGRQPPSLTRQNSRSACAAAAQMPVLPPGRQCGSAKLVALRLFTPPCLQLLSFHIVSHIPCVCAWKVAGGRGHCPCFNSKKQAQNNPGHGVT